MDDKFTHVPRRPKFFGLKKEVFGFSATELCRIFREIYLYRNTRQSMFPTDIVERTDNTDCIKTQKMEHIFSWNFAKQVIFYDSSERAFSSTVAYFNVFYLREEMN